MIQTIGTKLQVQLDQEGSEQLKVVNFSNVITEITEEQVLALGDVMKNLSAGTNTLNGVVKTHQTRITQ